MSEQRDDRRAGQEEGRKIPAVSASLSCLYLWLYLSSTGYSLNVEWFAERKQIKPRGRGVGRAEAALIFLSFDFTQSLPVS